MAPADGIRKLGFRRWYERELIESHAWFFTCFLCAILALALFEAVDLREDGWNAAGSLALVLGAGALGAVALARYRSLLARAEHIAERSTCAQCAAYGRLHVLAASGSDAEHTGMPPWMRVQCRECGHQWLIE